MELKRLSRNNAELMTGDRTILFSYDNPVAVRVGGTVYVTDKYWSRTTAGHIKEWTRGAPSIKKVSQRTVELLTAGREVNAL